MFTSFHILTIFLALGRGVLGKQYQNITIGLSKHGDSLSSNNNEQFYFDMDHDFDAFAPSNIETRSSISMVANDTFYKRDQLGGNNIGLSTSSSSQQAGGTDSSDGNIGGSSNPNAQSTDSQQTTSQSSNSQSISNDNNGSPSQSSNTESMKQSDSSNSQSNNNEQQTNSQGTMSQNSNEQQGNNQGTNDQSINNQQSNDNIQENQSQTDQQSSSSSSNTDAGTDAGSSSSSTETQQQQQSLSSKESSSNQGGNEYSATNGNDEGSNNGNNNTSDNQNGKGALNNFEGNDSGFSNTSPSSSTNLGPTDESTESNVSEGPEDTSDNSQDTDADTDSPQDGDSEEVEEEYNDDDASNDNSDDLEADANLEYYNNGISDGDDGEIKDATEEDVESDSDSDGSEDEDDSSADTRVLDDAAVSAAMTNSSIAGGEAEDGNEHLDAEEAPGVQTEEGVLDEEDDEEDEGESFDSDTDGKEDPEETGDEDYDSSEDGQEQDLENEENEEDVEEEGDEENENNDYEDLDNDVLDDEDEGGEDDEGDEEMDEDNGGEEEDDELEEDNGDHEGEGELDTRNHDDKNASPEDTALNLGTNPSPGDSENGAMQGMFGGLKKFGRKIKKGLRKIGRKIRRRKGRKIRLRKIKINKGLRKLKLKNLKSVSIKGRFGRKGKFRFGRKGKFRLGMKGKFKIRRKGKFRIRHRKMGSKMIKLGGKLIRLPGKKIRIRFRGKKIRFGGRKIRIGGRKIRRIKIRIKQSFKISLMGFWDWRRYIRGFKYESIGKANVGILIDGSIKKHLGMVQRWIYNLVLLFQRGSYVSFGTYSGKVRLGTDFKTFSSASAIKQLLQTMKPQGGPRKIGEALEFYYPLFKAAASKSKLKSILFLFATGVNGGSAAKMKEYGLKYRKLGVVIFVFGLGSRTSVSQFRSITTSTRVFTAGNYKSVILGGMGLRLGYKPGMRRSIFVILQSRLSRWLGMKVGLPSKHATHHHGHSHREWWFSMWNWYKYIGLRYGSIGRANIAFVVDCTNAELIMFLQRFIYNLARLFQSQGTSISILAYGKNQYVVTKWQSFTSAQALQAQASAIPFIKAKYRNTAAAMVKMLRLYRTVIKPSSPKIPKLLFLLSTGPSTDTKKFVAVRSLCKQIGVHVFTFGIGPEGKRSSKQLQILATSPRFAFAGDVTGLIQKASFTMFSGGLLKLVGAGNAMQYATGTKIMRKVQFKWNWRIGMRSIRYGYLGKANIGILVDGVQAMNFGYIRRFVYNIIRMYSLSGTYVNLMVYGSKVFRVANFDQIRSPEDIKNLVKKMPKVSNGKRRTGAALQTMLKSFGDAPPGNPNILYLIIQGPSSDKVVAPAALLRKYGIKTLPIGIGTTVSPKELAGISFSSSTIFKSGPNGLVHTLNNIQSAAVTISGTVSKACGKAGHTRCGKKDIVKQWEWKTYGIKFTYGGVARASIIFLIDGTNRNHFDVMQKLCYNIYKLFAPGTSAAVITYGGGTNKKLAKFRTFSDATAFQAFISAVDYRDTPGRNTGAGLAAALASLKSAPGGKKICFLLTTGKSSDDVSGPAKAMVKSGVSIFALGIGKLASKGEMKKISRFYLVTSWRGLLTSMVKVANSLKRVVGGAGKPEPDVGPQPEPPQGDPPKKPPLPVPTGGFIASSSTQSVGLLQTKWDWFKMMNLKPGVLSGCNVIVVLDVTKRDNIDIIQRFVAQIMLLFKLSESSFSLVFASDTPAIGFNGKVFGSNQDVINAVKMIKPKLSGKLKTGKALMLVKKNILPALKNDKKIPVMFLITRTKSSDDISKASEQIRGSGCKTVGVGIGNDYSQEELGMVSINGQLGLSGTITALPALISRIIFGLNVIVNGPPDAPILTLSGMAGKMPTLAGAVMNTVQTGSVPSETAGQSGNPSTGSTAGDVQGDDTAGTAGAPEEGGATKPDGTASKPPAQPPAPGPKETSGGATGAGGSDVSAGGGVAGATEAIAGQSKQDGGTGGPADGKVTTGNSNKPVTPEGEPAPAPVKPDGTPVEPTNPDGSPGTGPAKPDGTPANPDASSPPGVNSDGTPSTETTDPEKKPGEAPVVTPGGAATETVPPAGATGGCQCPGKCPQGCVPVMCTSPTQKNCIGKDVILKKFSKGISKNDDTKSMSALKSVLKDYFNDEYIQLDGGEKKTSIPEFKRGGKIEAQMSGMK